MQFNSHGTSTALRSIEKTARPSVRQRSTSPDAKNVSLQKSGQSALIHSFWETLSVIKRTEKCFFPFVRVVFSPRGDKRRGISSAVQESRQSVLPTPASGMLVSVRLCAHSQLEPRYCLSHSAGRECQLSPSRHHKVQPSYYKCAKTLVLIY